MLTFLHRMFEGQSGHHVHGAHKRQVLSVCYKHAVCTARNPSCSWRNRQSCQLFGVRPNTAAVRTDSDLLQGPLPSEQRSGLAMQLLRNAITDALDHHALIDATRQRIKHITHRYRCPPASTTIPNNAIRFVPPFSFPFPLFPSSAS